MDGQAPVRVVCARSLALPRARRRKLNKEKVVCQSILPRFVWPRRLPKTFQTEKRLPRLSGGCTHRQLQRLPTVEFEHDVGRVGEEEGCSDEGTAGRLARRL